MVNSFTIIVAATIQEIAKVKGYTCVLSEAVADVKLPAEALAAQIVALGGDVSWLEQFKLHELARTVEGGDGHEEGFIYVQPILSTLISVFNFPSCKFDIQSGPFYSDDVFDAAITNDAEFSEYFTRCSILSSTAMEATSGKYLENGNLR